ncbi:MAG: DUF6339 family protein [Clostridia bacterium]|nr:DUF6339 family protein [Clostridia bacterium]
MKQKIFKTKVLNKIEEDIIVNKKYYIEMLKNPNWLKKMFEEANNNNYEVSSQIEVEQFELIIGDAKTDKQNARIVYENLKSLNPVQAVTSELWAYMTHIEFPEYMAKRWKIDDKEDEKKVKELIKLRYFAKRGGKGIVRNGIARLWWAGYWGYDPKRENPFELVDVILDKQETYEHISERLYNRNRNILIASLETIKENDFNSKQIRKLYGKINSYGSDKHLDALNMEDARLMVEELVEEIKKSEERELVLV